MFEHSNIVHNEKLLPANSPFDLNLVCNGSNARPALALADWPARWQRDRPSWGSR